MKTKLDGDGRVFGLGLSRTGTTSLGHALSTLGIRTIHYPSDARTRQQLRGGDYRLDILERFRGVVDTPVVPFYAQFDRHYPGSKFILTVRDRKPWLASVRALWKRDKEAFIPNADVLDYRHFVRAAVYGTLSFNEDRLDFVYETHVRNVLDYFRGRQTDLLVLDICAGEGWDKLCPFLDAAVPDVPFPVSNTAESWPAWRQQLLQIARDLAEVVPEDAGIVVVNGGDWNPADVLPYRSWPFLERDGEYWGSPPDDATAIAELERLMESGATFIMFSASAFWWLDHYGALARLLRTRSRCVLDNERLVLFDLHERREH